MSMKGVLSTMKRRLSGQPGQGDGGDGGGGGAAQGGAQHRPSNIMRGSSTPASDSTSTTPRADVTLPRRERRRSSLLRHQKIQALKDLPTLKETAPQKREALFQQKLSLCSVIFNFEDPNSDKRGKDLKRQTLLELVDYVNNAGGQKIFNEALMPDIMNCVSVNICRAVAWLCRFNFF